MDRETLQALGVDIDEIKERIIEDATSQVADEISKSIGKKVKSDLIKRAENAVGAQINAIVEQVASQVFQPVNTWGDAEGKPTTIRDMMESEMASWWSARVDKSGHPTSSYGAKLTRSEYFAQKLVGDYIDRALKQDMKAIIEAGKAKIRQAMAAAVTKQIEEIW